MKIDFSKITLQEWACFVYEILKSYEINVVLVGGACVSIYSENRYQSMDVNFATYEELKPIEKILQQYGFKRQGRSFRHEDCPYLIDFVNPPITVGHEAVHQFKKLQTASGSLVLLLPTDCVKDRLSAFFHWNDKPSLDQAILVAKSHQIDIENIKKWAKAEGFPEKFDYFLKLMIT